LIVPRAGKGASQAQVLEVIQLASIRDHRCAQGAARRKLRALLTAISIVLGVAMISGTFVLTDTIKAAFRDVFQPGLQGTPTA